MDMYTCVYIYIYAYIYIYIHMYRERDAYISSIAIICYTRMLLFIDNLDRGGGSCGFPAGLSQRISARWI